MHTKPASGTGSSLAIEEECSFVNGRGQRLTGTWHLPDGECERSAVIAHGLLSTRDSSKHTEICRRLAASGTAAVRFDFAGRGQSEGSLEQLTVSGQIDDLTAAIDEARRRGFGEIAVAGSSMGGAVSVLVASKTASIATLVTMAAPARLPRSVRPSWDPIEDPVRGERLGSAFFSDAVRHDVAAAARRVTASWRILHGARDEVVPAADAAVFAAANPAAAVEIHPEADHRFSAVEHREWLVDRVVEWITGARRA
jgi:alpha/beta superfamily hydrolase